MISSSPLSPWPTTTTTTMRSLSTTTTAAATTATDNNDTNNFNNNDLYAELDPHDQRMLNMLMEYKTKYGDVHVPSNNTKAAIRERERLNISSELVTWIRQQRQLYRRATTTTTNNNNNSSSSRNRTTTTKKKSASSSSSLLTNNKQLQVKILVLDSMGFLWTDREAQWQRNFNKLEQYGQHHDGNYTISKQDDRQMYTWMDEQRKKYQLNKLSQPRMELLQEIGFEFDLHKVRWWKFYKRLQDYKQQHGDTLVPINYRPDRPLAQWVARQRRSYSDGRLSNDRIEALQDIGFIWSVRGDIWEFYYDQLEAFYKEHGHTRVPPATTTDCKQYSLSRWVERQRRMLRNRSGGSSISSSDPDDGLLLLSSTSSEEEDDDNDDDDGVDNNNDDEEDSDDDEDDVIESRIRRLEELTVPRGVQDDLWKKQFRRLWDFKEKFGHFTVPYDDPKYSELSSWMRYQRYLYKRGRLPMDRVMALDGIDFLWSAHQARWDRMYEELIRFHAEHGHSRVPTKYGDLYRWTLQQRKALLEGRNMESSSPTTEEEGGGSGSSTDNNPNKELIRRFPALEKILLD